MQTVSKALRGAVGEARKNFEQLQGSHSRTPSTEVRKASDPEDATAGEVITRLADRLSNLEERNKVLAKMLENTQEILRKWKSSSSLQHAEEEDAFNTALAKIQFVSVYLADSDIPIPQASPVVEHKALQLDPSIAPGSLEPANPTVSDIDTNVNTLPGPQGREVETVPSASQAGPAVGGDEDRLSSTSPTRKSGRPSLAESSFSFMLGEDRHRSSFIRSKPLPEERRNSDAQKERERKDSDDVKMRQKQNRERKDRKPTSVSLDIDDDGFTMSTLQ